MSSKRGVQMDPAGEIRTLTSLRDLGALSGPLVSISFIAGLASAVTGLLSPLYFVTEPAAWFIPAGWFSGLLVSGIAGARLGRCSA